MTRETKTTALTLIPYLYKKLTLANPVAHSRVSRIRNTVVQSSQPYYVFTVDTGGDGKMSKDVT